MIDNTALFLDFDGVICDSYVECFSMSWYAYFHLFRGEKVMSMDMRSKSRFRSLRPLVRNSEDNVVIQHILAQDLRISSQEEFDTFLQALGPQKLQKMRTNFYEARDFFLAEYRDFWLGLNYIFPVLVGPLHRAQNNSTIYILSTKKPAFIDEILQFNCITWPFLRILEAHGRSKEEIILDIIDNQGFDKAVFIDDQIDHLRSNGKGRIACFLAEWGYVSEVGLKDFTVSHMTIEECVHIIDRFGSQ